MRAKGEKMGKLGYMRLAGVSAVALLSGLSVSQDANAGGFAIREQSSQFQGTSWAGDAAGGGLSSMFWNPAATATLDGTNTETVATLVTSDGEFKSDPTNKPGYSTFGNEVYIPASYSNYQVNDRLYIGLALNSPFGFITKPDQDWAGSVLAKTSKVFSIDINPDIAYKLTPELTIGVGAQIEYVKIRLNSASGLVPTGVPSPAFVPVSGRETKGDDWTAGATAGLIWQPAPGTTLGLGYRSPVEIDTNATCTGSSPTTVAAKKTYTGGLAVFAPCSGTGTVKFDLPETVTFSFRQDVNQRLAVLGTVEWTHHDRLQTIYVYDSAGKPMDEIPLNFKDGWLGSIGAEYKYSPSLTVRTGVAYEWSPVDDTNRQVFLPDSNRVWVSGGATYKWSERLSFDLAYSHLFFEENTHLNNLSNAYANGSADIFSTAAKYKLSAGLPPLEPYK